MGGAGYSTGRPTIHGEQLDISSEFQDEPADFSAGDVGWMDGNEYTHRGGIHIALEVPPPAVGFNTWPP